MDIDQERTCDFKSESEICLTRVAVASEAGRSTETIRADGEWRKKCRIYYCTKRRDELYGCEKERE